MRPLISVVVKIWKRNYRNSLYANKSRQYAARFIQIETFLQYTPAASAGYMFWNFATSLLQSLQMQRRQSAGGGLSYYATRGRAGESSARGFVRWHPQGSHPSGVHPWGVFNHDPHGLFEGRKNTKRFVRLESYDDAPWDDLKAIDQLLLRVSIRAPV